MAQPQATARTDQVAQSFMAWLQGRVPSPQLLQQFFAENPDQLQALQTGATPGFSGRDTFEAARA